MNRSIMMTTGVAALLLGASAPAARAQTTAAPAIAAATAPKAAHDLRRLAMSSVDATFQGERVSRRWPAFVTTADAGRATTFQLTFMNAVSALPELSRVVVSINGRQIASAPLDASRGFKTLMIRVPEGVTTPGFNAVKFDVVQRHRVDCSVAGAFELWTALDASRTGFVVPVGRPQAITGLENLPAVPAASDGTTQIRIRLAPDAPSSLMDAALEALQATVLAGHFLRPLVDVSTAPQDGPGLDLFVGSSSEIAAAGGPRPIPGAASFAMNGARGSLSIDPSDAPAFATALADLRTAGEAVAKIGDPLGIEALSGASGREIESGERVPLAELGASTEEFNGRLLRETFKIVMPSGFFAADYGAAELMVGGSSTSAEAGRVRLVARINDVAVSGTGSLPMDGGVLDSQTLTLPLRYLRPGSNDIVLEVEAEGKADCDPTREASPRSFRLSPASMFVFPRLAALPTLPDLGAALSAKADSSGAGRATGVHIADSTPLAMSSAATVIANVAVASGSSAALRLRVGLPDAERSGGIVITPFDRLGSSDSARLAALRTATSALDSGGRQAEPAKKAIALNDHVQANKLWVRGHFDAAIDAVRVYLETAGFVYVSQPAPASAPRIPDQGLVAFQAVIRSAGGKMPKPFSTAEDAQVRTTVSASSEESLNEALRALVASGNWERLRGETATYDSESGTLRSARATEPVYVVGRDFSIPNTRLVAAGLFSLNIPLLIVVLLATCACLGLTTHAVLKRSGARV